MNQSENINELALALSKAQGEISPAIKDSSNPFFKSKYADLTSVWNACRDPLSKNGLAVIQTMQDIDSKLTLITTLVHASGQWIKSFLPIVSQKQDAQSLGAAITYMRRFSLSALVGICPEDDDGNVASGNVSTSKNNSPLPKEEIINHHQFTLLLNKLESVPQYMSNVKTHLSNQSPRILDLRELPISMFEAIMKGADKAIEQIKLKSA